MRSYQIGGAVLREGEATIPVVRTADVVVAGGGPAGLVAAIAAARAGATVVLVEQNAFLGGVATGAMMAALVASPCATGIGLELIDRLAAAGGAPRWEPLPGRSHTTPFDPEVFKRVALEMAVQAGVEVMLYTTVAGPIVIDGAACGVMLESKSGRQAVLGTVVIDATGDADLAAAAGAPCTKGRETDGKMRPFALLFRIGGLDIPAIARYVEEYPDELQPQYRRGTWLQVGEEDVVTRISGFYRLVEAAKAQGELPPELHYFRLENLWVQRGTAICNTTRVYGVDGTDAGDLTRGELAARRQIEALMAFVRKRLPGGERAFLIDVAPRLGVRETRRIIGAYTLTDEDAYGDATFDDAIMTMEGMLVKLPRPAHLDVHMPEPIEGSPQDLLERDPESIPRERHRFQIPYRVLLPQGVEQLLVAGRTIAVSHMIDGWTRNMLVCMRMGQVAGAAAALAVQRNDSPRHLDFAVLREALLAQEMAAI